MRTAGTGIGGGLVIEDQVFRGATGSGAELGHMVIDEDGARCQGNCPNHGCLEAVASGRALEREARALAPDRPGSEIEKVIAEGRELTGSLVTELAHDGDAAAREVITLIGTRLGVGIANYINIFNPEVVVIGGGVIAAGDLLLQPARDEVTVRALRPNQDIARIVPAHFGNEAGMLGAAALAFDGIARPEGEAARAWAPRAPA